MVECRLPKPNVVGSNPIARFAENLGVPRQNALVGCFDVAEFERVVVDVFFGLIKSAETARSDKINLRSENRKFCLACPTEI